MAVTRVHIKKCRAYDDLLDVKCNQPKGHDGNHRYAEGSDLQFSWADAEKKDTTVPLVEYEEYSMFPMIAES